MNYLEISQQRDVAVIRMNDPEDKINKLGKAVMSQFPAVLDKVEKGYKAVVLISGKSDNFIAGADIEMFAELTEPGQAAQLCAEGLALLARIESFPVPIIAAINGACLGGGLEVALACSWRICSDDPKTVFGLPEVKLGLLPGLGGTQRLPRLVGLQGALDMLATGKNVYSSKARKMNLVDRVTHRHALEAAAVSFALEMVERPLVRKRRKKLLDRFLESGPGRGLVFNMARKAVLKQTAGNYPAPLEIIKVVKAGFANRKQGFEAESAGFDRLVRTRESRNLVQLFFGMNATRKNPMEDQANPVKSIGVLGAGLMGAGIAEVTVPRDISVILKDISGESLARGEKMIWESFNKKVKKRIMSEFERDRLMAQIHGATRDSELAGVDMVIEAVFEDLNLKQRVLAAVEEHCGENCIFASNTSSLPIAQIAARARRPERVIGMHYFSPVPKMPLLEIIVTDLTAPQVTATAIRVGILQGKNVIVVKDGPGFYTTRILGPMLNEAVTLLEEGAAIEDLDRAMFQYGFPVGPITLLDEVGIDVGAHVGDILQEMFVARVGSKPSGTIRELFEAGYQGRKNGKGFYDYSLPRKKGKKAVNPEIYSFFGGSSRRKSDYGEIQQRLCLAMVNEAAWCLEEGILSSPQDGDLGAILGLGFPPFRGGPFRFLDAEGPRRVADLLADLREKHGPRFTPANILRDTTRFHKV